MAITIESTRQRGIANNPVSGQKQSINAPADAFGAGNARALTQGGDALGKFADQMGNRELKVLDKANRARALDLENQMQTELNSFLYDPEQGLLKRKGVDAISSQALMQEKLQEVKKKYIGIKGEAPDVLETMNASFSNISKTYDGVAQRHAFSQTEEYEKDALTARIELNRQDAAIDFLNEDLFNKKLGENVKALEIRADMEGWGADRLKLEKQKETSTLRAAQITSMINTDQPYNILLAKQEFEAGKARGDFVFDQAMTIETSLNAAVPKAAATLEFQRLGTGVGGVVGQDNIIGVMVDKIEGGDKIAQEPRGAIAKFGINSEANPDVDVANLDREGAIKLYKKRYWDAYKIDDVPENLQFLAFDIAVNHRSDFARTVIKELAEGNIDANSTLAYRMDEYKRLAQSDPATYGQYLEGWKGRLTEVAKITAGNKTPDINDVQASAQRLEKMHPDAGAELMKMYESQIKRRNDIEKAQKNEFEDQIQAKVAENGGDYTVLSAAERSQAAQLGIDYTKYTGASNPETIVELEAMTENQLSSVDLTELRGDLTFEDLNKWRTKQSDLQKPENALAKRKIDDVVRYYFRTELSADPDNKKYTAQVAAMNSFIGEQLEVRYESMGEVTDKDINELAATFFRNRVYDPPGRGNRIGNVFTMDVDQIPDKLRAEIEKSIIADGKLLTENEIKERFILRAARVGDLKGN